MNVYDFDKTIYNGDSSIDFYLFCIKKNPKVLLAIPNQIKGLILYLFKIKNKVYFKESYFFFLKYIKDIDKMVDIFWEHNIKKITLWYLKQKSENDIIISASPYFLLNPLEKKLKINKVIATDVNKKNGKFNSKNCYGEEKVKMIKKYIDINKIDNFYTDSVSDVPLLKKAKVGYIVNNKKNKFNKFK